MDRAIHQAAGFTKGWALPSSFSCFCLHRHLGFSVALAALLSFCSFALPKAEHYSSDRNRWRSLYQSSKAHVSLLNLHLITACQEIIWQLHHNYWKLLEKSQKVLIRELEYQELFKKTPTTSIYSAHINIMRRHTLRVVGTICAHQALCFKESNEKSLPVSQVVMPYHS